ncbi:MAG TPA: hypothetical protein VGF33_07010 [Caulobacteraceae bacterium]|jgi:hypothetical protein
MRLLTASLIAAVGAAPLAYAQTAAPTSTPPAAAPAAPPPAAAAAAPTTTPPAAPPAAAPAPATPPAPPTDPVAISLLDALQNVCVPAVEGGPLDRLAKAHNFHKSGDDYVEIGRNFRLTILAPGSNPTQCHVDIVHPVYPEAPAAPIVVALHNWAAVERDWSLYRNDKSAEGGQELTTRSWEHDDPGKHEAMFITTFRHADGTPTKGNADTSTMVYSETKS